MQMLVVSGHYYNADPNDSLYSSDRRSFNSQHLSDNTKPVSQEIADYTIHPEYPKLAVPSSLSAMDIDRYTRRINDPVNGEEIRGLITKDEVSARLVAIVSNEKYKSILDKKNPYIDHSYALKSQNLNR